MLDPLRRLIDAVPRATLAEIIHEMLAAEPAKRRGANRPRARGRPRKARTARRRDAKPNGAAAGPDDSPAPPRRPRGRAAARDPGAEAFWAKAAALSDAPWNLVSDRLAVHRAVALDAWREKKLPPGISAETAAAFA